MSSRALRCVFLVVAATGPGCAQTASSGDPPPSCTPGEQRACACPGSTVTGAQECSDDGRRFGACQGCGATSSSSGSVNASSHSASGFHVEGDYGFDAQVGFRMANPADGGVKDSLVWVLLEDEGPQCMNDQFSGFHLSIAVDGADGGAVTPGTYQVWSTPGSAFIYRTELNQNFVVGQSGTVTITTLTDSRVAGSFAALLANDAGHGTVSGSFDVENCGN